MSRPSSEVGGHLTISIIFVLAASLDYASVAVWCRLNASVTVGATLQLVVTFDSEYGLSNMDVPTRRINFDNPAIKDGAPVLWYGIVWFNVPLDTF